MMAALSKPVEEIIGCFKIREVRGLEERNSLLLVLEVWESVSKSYLEQSSTLTRRFPHTASIWSGYYDDTVLCDNCNGVIKTFEQANADPESHSRDFVVRKAPYKKVEAVVQCLFLRESIFISALLSAPDNLQWSPNVKCKKPRSRGAGSAAFKYVCTLAKQLGKKELRTYPLTGAISFYTRLGMKWDPEKRVYLLTL